MLLNLYLMSLMMVFVLLLFLKVYEHYLMVLMCMEFLILLVLYSIYYSLSINSQEYFFLVFMVFFVIDSVLGLALLILLSHNLGNDQMKNMNLIMW